MTKAVKSDEIGYHQMKLDHDAYLKICHEREFHKSKGRHVSFSDAFREIYQDALLYRKSLR